MSIYEVTNLETGSVEIVESACPHDLRKHFYQVKIAALDPNEYIQVVYYRVGVIHNENDPAIVYANGCKQWYSNGKLHNENGPAVVYVDGNKEWFIHGSWLRNNEYNNEK